MHSSQQPIWYKGDNKTVSKRFCFNDNSGWRLKIIKLEANVRVLLKTFAIVSTWGNQSFHTEGTKKEQSISLS